jgi:hypothetical protein
MRLALAVSALAALAGAGGARAAETDLDLMAVAYASPLSTAADGTAGLSYQPGQGLVRWRYGEALVGPSENYGLRLSTATLDANPATALMRPGAPANGDGLQAFELTVIRQWVGAVSVKSKRVSLDITPHAGLGLSSAGTQLAEVGALLRVNRAIDAVGAQGLLDGARLSLFAGLQGRATGANLLSTQALGVRDNSRGNGFVREAQAGVGFNRGVLHASFGYTHERLYMKALGEDVRHDSRVGLTLAFRPHR